MTNQTILPVNAVFDRDTGSMIGFLSPGGVVIPIGSGSGSSTFDTLTDKASADIASTNTSVAAVKATALAAIANAVSWDANTNIANPGASQFSPASGIAPLGGKTLLLCLTTGSTVLDGNTFLVGDMALYSPSLGVWTKIATAYLLAGAADLATINLATSNTSVGAIKTKADAALPAFIAPRTEGSTVTLAAADNGGTSVTPVNCVATVNTGLGAGFGRGFRGAGVVTFAGTATVNDRRTTGAANPTCALMCIGTDIYDCVGSKA